VRILLEGPSDDVRVHCPSSDNVRMVADALLDALDRLRNTGPEFNSFLANHGPMAAEAIVQLGADDEVAGWVTRYRTRLTPEPAPRDRIEPADWRSRLGDVRYVGDWTVFFELEIAESGWRRTLTEWWPRLLPGLSASATHGMIRTAHAVRSLTATGGDSALGVLNAELARGLGLWAARFQLLPGAPTLTGPEDAVTAMAALPRLDPAAPSAGPGVGGRLASLGALPDLPAAMDGWGSPVDPDDAITAIVSAAARVVAAREDAPIAFCHAVTAPAALRLVLPVLPADLHRATVAGGWQVVAGLIAAFAAPPDTGERIRRDVDPAPLLADLAARAVEHGDEHVIKLAEAALREYRISGDTTVLVGADRFRGRIEPA
jgi:hypothetical protein